MICDFCNGTPIEWCYPATDFAIEFDGVMMPFDLGSFGGWAACQLCHEAIERDGVLGSSQRTVRSMGDIVSAPVCQMVLDLHKKFFAHRTGPPTPYKE